MAMIPEDAWPTDADLYRRLLEKRKSAWDELFWRLYPRMVDEARMRIKEGALAKSDMVDAEDVAAELGRRWPRIMESFDPDRARDKTEPISGRIRAYINVAFNNAYNSWYTKQARRMSAHRPLPGDVESGAMTPPQEYDLIELSEIINSLPAPERELFEMKFDEGLTFAEIAERLDIKPSKAYQLVRRLVQELESRLG